MELTRDATGFDINTTSATIASIAAGDSGDFTITGTVTQAGVDAGLVVLNATVAEDEADADTGDNSASATATVVAPTSDVSGKFFDFADSTHGVAGAKIKLTNQADSTKTFSATSDGTGAFTVADVPNGFYDITVTAPDGWAVHGTPQQTTSVPTSGSLDFALDQVAAPITTTTTVGAPTTTTGHAAPILANTGTPIRWIAGGGAGVIVVGTVLLLLARRRRETAEIPETPSS